MTHLRIELNTTGIEEVNSSVIEKLYELVNSGDLDASSNLLGRLHTDITYLDYITYLLGQFPGTNNKGPLYITSTNIALRFTDPEVLRVLVANGIGSNGLISSSDAAALTDIYTVSGAVNWFLGNTTIVTLNDLNNFPNLHIIRSAAFKDCTSLTNVNLSNITTINANAFLNDTALLTVNLSGLTTMSGTLLFKGCTVLTSANIGSVTAISNSAFYGCTNLATIDLSNVTSIGTEAFSGCTSLTSANLEKVTSIGNSAFLGCTALTSVDLSSCTSLGQAIFRGCTGLTTIDLSNCTTIGSSVFRGCTGLTTVTLSNSLTIIPNYCFSGDTALTTINGGTGITTINEGAFSGCSNLINTFDFTNTLSIAKEAFKNCSKCTFTNFDNVSSFGSNCLLGCTISGSYSFKSNVSIGYESFMGTNIQEVRFLGSGTIEFNAFKNCKLLTSIIFDGDVKLGSGCFSNCTNVLSVDLSNISNASLNYSSSGYTGGLFSECKNLSQIVLNSNITTIPQNFAAYNNTVPLSITIPASVTSIGANAFYATKVDITILATTPPTWGNNNSLSDSAVSIKVPNGCLSAYLSASGWSMLANKMSELPA